MRPIDLRNETFAAIGERLEGQRRHVYDALRTLGPHTTRQLAELARIDLLTVRPRVTELIELGLVELVQPEGAQAVEGRGAREGVYRALTMAEAQALFDQRWQAANKEEQLTLRHHD